MAQTGHRDEAMRAFDPIGSELRARDLPLHLCVLSHHMADLQDDPAEELVWDLRALDAGRRACDADIGRVDESLTIAQLFPSLHLNCADAYLRLGDCASCAVHVQAGLAFLDELPNGAYKTMVKRGLDRTSEALRLRLPEPLSPHPLTVAAADGTSIPHRDRKLIRAKL